MIKISEKELQQLKTLRTKQDQNVMIVGSMAIEFFRGFSKMLNTIDNTEKDQTRVGEMILSSYNLDFQKDTYTIDMGTGVIKILKNTGTASEYVDIEGSED